MPKIQEYTNSKNIGNAGQSWEIFLRDVEFVDLMQAFERSLEVVRVSKSRKKRSTRSRNVV